MLSEIRRRRFGSGLIRAIVSPSEPMTLPPMCGGDQPPSVRECRVRPGELERCDLDIALADREIDVVTLGPRPIDVGIGSLPVDAVPPCRSRNQARARPRDVDPGSLPEPVALCPVLDLAVLAARPRPQPEAIEVDVRRGPGGHRSCRPPRTPHRRRCAAPNPPTSKEPVSLKMVSGSISPSSSAAVAVIGLNADPVGYPPCIARSAAERRSAARGGCTRPRYAAGRRRPGRRSGRSRSRARRRWTSIARTTRQAALGERPPRRSPGGQCRASRRLDPSPRDAGGPPSAGRGRPPGPSARRRSHAGSGHRCARDRTARSRRRLKVFVRAAQLRRAHLADDPERVTRRALWVVANVVRSTLTPGKSRWFSSR